MTTELRRRCRRVTAVALAACATLVAGCSSGGTSSNSDADVDRSAMLRFANGYGVSSFDPHRTPASATDALFQRNVYETLVVQVQDDVGHVELKPRLATEWSIADDAKTIDFTLREGVTFQDGTPFDAEAVKLNFDRARGPQSTVASTLKSLESVEVVNPSHVRLHLSTRTPDLIWTLASNVAGNMASPAAFDNDLATRPVGTGPFTLTSVAPNEIKFARWDGYRNANTVLLAGIDYSVVSDDNARLNGLRSNQFDAAHFVAPTDVQAKKLVESDGFQWQDAPSSGPMGLYLNQTKAPLDNPDVRRAIYLAVDRKTIAETLFNGSVVPSGQLFTPATSIGWDPDANVAEAYGPDEARRLVERAGATGARITVAVGQAPVSMTLGQAVQDQLGRIGLEVELQPYAPAEPLPTYLRGNVMGVIYPANSSADPFTIVDTTLLRDRNLGTPTAELVRLTEKAESYPVGSEERAGAYVGLSEFVATNPENFVPMIIQRFGLLLSPKVVLDHKYLFSENTTRVDWVGVGLRG